jgi:hypothetical protein
MMMQFHKSNVEEEWWDLINEFPEFILDLSPTINEWYQETLLLADDYGSMPKNKEDLINLRYSFECGMGWKTIIREYFQDMKDLISDAKSNGDDINYKTCIFKEKFGEICDQGDFYGKDRMKYWDQYIQMGRTLREKSITTCEDCGNVGFIRKRGKRWGWIKCLCDKHSEEREYN